MLWIATVSGITIADPRSAQIKSHPEFSSEYQFSTTSFIRDSKSHFWIGGTRGLVHFDEKMRNLELIREKRSD